MVEGGKWGDLWGRGLRRVCLGYEEVRSGGLERREVFNWKGVGWTGIWWRPPGRAEKIKGSIPTRKQTLFSVLLSFQTYFRFFCKPLEC